ncbi:MAG TPA: response regulator transcription factor [Ohtaekwangia sp.]|uniref:response regulator transcription factor n=1 Tax=Ohtaekwangia sp. TaxID=2066019 RepID=UPI002F91E6B0
MKPLSILTVDDQALFREGLTLVLNKLYPNATVKQASSGQQALDALRDNRFDLMLLDIGMPGMNGMEVAKQVMLDHPSVRIIILTQYNGEAMITHLVQAGVHGFLLKNSESQEIKKAVETVLSGKQYITSMIHPSLLKEEKVYNAPSVRFSKREADILMYLKLGKSSKEIAERLSLKENTINSYREDMLRKTKTSNVAELISYAYKNGVLG